jgi:citrate lyase synthetase
MEKKNDTIQKTINELQREIIKLKTIQEINKFLPETTINFFSEIDRIIGE